MDNRPPIAQELVDAYRQALVRGDEDAVQEAIMRVINDALREGGTGSPEAVQEAVRVLLARGAPRLIKLAEWRARDQRRTELRRRSLIADASTEELGLVANTVPDDEADRQEKLHTLAKELNELPQEDLVVLWGRARGFSYEEVQALWREWGMGEPPKAAALRQRYRRALDQLRSSRLNLKK
jgi:hypothetical protein